MQTSTSSFTTNSGADSSKPASGRKDRPVFDENGLSLLAKQDVGKLLDAGADLVKEKGTVETVN